MGKRIQPPKVLEAWNPDTLFRVFRATSKILSLQLPAERVLGASERVWKRLSTYAAVVDVASAFLRSCLGLSSIGVFLFPGSCLPLSSIVSSSFPSESLSPLVSQRAGGLVRPCRSAFPTFPPHVMLCLGWMVSAFPRSCLLVCHGLVPVCLSAHLYSYFPLWGVVSCCIFLQTINC